MSWTEEDEKAMQEARAVQVESQVIDGLEKALASSEPEPTAKPVEKHKQPQRHYAHESKERRKMAKMSRKKNRR